MNTRRKYPLPCFIVLFLLGSVLFAQAQGKKSLYKSPLAPNIAIDGGLFMLMAVATIYGGTALCRKD